MDQRRALQGMVGALFPEMPVRLTAQFVVDPGNQAIERAFLSIGPLRQQLGDGLGRDMRHAVTALLGNSEHYRRHSPKSRNYHKSKHLLGGIAVKCGDTQKLAPAHEPFHSPDCTLVR